MSAGCIEAKCPYCGTANTVPIKSAPESHVCDIEVGGCDEWFIVQTTTFTRHVVRVGKVELAVGAQT